jgi:hypothetical protein
MQEEVDAATQLCQAIGDPQEWVFSGTARFSDADLIKKATPPSPPSDDDVPIN